jgi:hypothetical protein
MGGKICLMVVEMNWTIGNDRFSFNNTKRIVRLANKATESVAALPIFVQRTASD